MADRGDRLSLALAPQTREVGPQRTPAHRDGYSTPLAETTQAQTQAQTPSPPRRARQSARQQGLGPPPPPDSPEREPAAVAPPEDGASGWDRVGAGVRQVGTGVEWAADK